MALMFSSRKFRLGVDLDLRGQVGAGVLLGIHVEGCELRVAQVLGLIGVVDSVRQRLGIVGSGHDPLPFVAHHDRGAGVLAARQLARRGDVGIQQQLESDEAIVLGGLGVIEDLAQLGEVTASQQVRHVVDRLGGQQPQCLGFHHEQATATDVALGHVFRRGVQAAVLGVVRAALNQGLVGEIGHAKSPRAGRAAAWGGRPAERNRSPSGRMAIHTDYRPSPLERLRVQTPRIPKMRTLQHPGTGHLGRLPHRLEIRSA